MKYYKFYKENYMKVWNHLVDTSVPYIRSILASISIIISPLKIKRKLSELETSLENVSLQNGILKEYTEEINRNKSEIETSLENVLLQNRILKEYTEEMNQNKSELETSLENISLQNRILKEHAEEMNRNKSELETSLENISLQNRILKEYAEEMNRNQIEFDNLSLNLPNSLQNINISSVPLDETSGILNWPELLTDKLHTNTFSELIRIFKLFGEEDKVVNKLSSCWSLLSQKNLDQLLEHGYNNFKRTIGHNYFNFLVQQGDPQIKAAEALLSDDLIESCRIMALSIQTEPHLSHVKLFSYYYFVFLLWEYVKQIDTKQYLEQLSEPNEGNPILVVANEKSMSQDLANSLIEYYAIDNAVSFQSINTILEIGGGYGRNAFVILSLNPNARIILVDILPALYIAQRYLSSVFKNRRLFKVRSFSSYAEVKDKIEESSIIFLMPHQLELMPDKSIDLCMNISSFGEMGTEQIKWYYTHIDRLVTQYFYTKQWFVSKNPFDDLVLNKSDYPSFNNWKEIFSRNCAVQSDFFETLYQVNHQ